MRAVITGAKGQLGHDLVRLMSEIGWEVYGYGREELDITNLEEVRERITAVRPEIIIHTAAYTKVDQAESESDLAYRINAFGSRNVAMAAEQIGAKICYISTDYVFDGQADSPYLEYDRVNPQSVYGKSKLAGEELVKSLTSRYYIVRTSWVFGEYGHNFVKTMLALADNQDEIRVVYDQVGSPTYTVDLAGFLIKLAQTECYGIYHATNTGSCSWYEFAKAIFEEAKVDIRVIPVSTEDFPRPAPRPKFSVLDHMSIRANGFLELRHWREGLKDYLRR